MIDLGALLLVVYYLFEVPILVLWVGFEKFRLLHLDGREGVQNIILGAKLLSWFWVNQHLH